MATSNEEILLRLGMDSSSMTRGTLAAMDVQKKAALDYVSYWEGALAKKDVAEKAQMEKSWARYVANLAKRKAADDAFFAAQSARFAERDAVAAIGAGSIPANMERRAAAGAAREGGHLAEGAVGGAVGGALANSSVMRETMTMIREGARGAWSKMLGSFSLLLGYIGITAGTIISAVPVVGAGLGGLFANWRMRKSLNDNFGGLYGSEGRISSADEDMSKRLQEIIGDIVKAGKLTSGQASDLMNSARTGGMSGIRRVQSILSPLMPGGKEGLAQAITEHKEAVKLEEEHIKKMLAMEREDLNGNSKITADMIQRHTIMDDMSRLQIGSLEWEQKRNELDDINLQILKDQKDAKKEALEITKQIGSLHKESQKAQKDFDSIDKFVPTISDLAGQGYASRLDKLYGSKGRFDIASGTGPLAQAARDALLYAKQQAWDVTHGNYGQAEIDRQNQMRAENMLSRAGIETPEMKQSKIADHLKEINDGISILARQAAHDGLNINTN